MPAHDYGVTDTAVESRRVRFARGPHMARTAQQSSRRRACWGQVLGQVQGSSGRLGALREELRRIEELRSVAEKERSQALFIGRFAEARILHGKEAVPGSSPGEGLNTCKSALSEDSRVPLVQGGTRTSGGPEAENSPQIRLFAESAEHLPEREGLDVVAEAVSSESRWKRDNRRRAVWRGEAWGQVLGTERAVRTCARSGNRWLRAAS